MKKLIKIRDSFGISIVELLITLSVISILSLVIMNFMVNWLQQYIVTQNRTQLLMQAQDTLDLVTNDIRLSSAADTQNRILDANAPDAPNNMQSWTSGESQLVLATAAEDEASNIIFSDPAQYISEKNNVIYFVQDEVLYRRILAADVDGNKATTTCPPDLSGPDCPSDRKMAEGVVNFSVRYFNIHNEEVLPNNARSIQMEITLRKRAFGQTIESSDRTRMVFRNG